jgi:hypothetical protein
VRDSSSGACWFYHVHAPDPSRVALDEHGHFHCFIHRRHPARHGRCLAAPSAAGKKHPQLSHVVALAIGHDGVPLRWFTVAQSVTDEYVYDAEAMMRTLHKFDFMPRGPLSPTTKWLQAMVGIYAPTIAALLQKRDITLKKARRGQEILSQAPLQFDAYLARLADLLD